MLEQGTGDAAERLNAFPLQVQDGATLTYRIWSVDPIPRSPEMRERIRKDLRWKHLNRPIFPQYSNGTFAFAVADWGRQDPVEFAGMGELRYVVAPTEDRRLIALDRLGDADADPVETGLAAEMLQQELLLHLRKHPELARGDRDDRYLINTPDVPFLGSGGASGRGDRNRGRRAAVDIYRGFTFRVVPIAGIGLCVVLDVFTSYIGSDTLARYQERGRGLPRGLQGADGVGRWVYDYGRRKPTVYLLRTLDRSIGEVSLGGGGTTYEYLLSTYPHLRGQIRPEDRAATIAYRLADVGDESKHYTAAATLLRPKFTTESSDVRALGDKAAFPPYERMRRIEIAIWYLEGARFAGRSVRLGPALSQPSRVLALPDLVFGPDERPERLSWTATGIGEVEARRGWGRRKVRALRQHGPYARQEFTNPFLVYPACLDDDSLLEDFVARTKGYCAEYGKVEFDPRLSSYRDGASAHDIIEKLKGIAEHQRAGFILLALPPDAERADRVYTAVKAQVDVASKCFSTANLRDQARRGGNRLMSYIENNALAMLVENGTRPWGLAEPLHHELQMGFDVARFRHGGLMGASVISNLAASDILFAYKEFGGRERMPANIIGPFVLQQLEHFYEVNGRAPRSILFQRDGKLLESELQGIQTALRRFGERHVGGAVPIWAAATIEKNTAVPLRVFRLEGECVERAYSGTYALQDPQTGWLVLAGGPGLRQGTPRAVQIEIRASSGETGLLPVLTDIFRLSHLNWNSPGIEISLPITLRFADQKLERYALESEVGEDLDEWGDQDE